MMKRTMSKRPVRTAMSDVANTIGSMASNVSSLSNTIGIHLSQLEIETALESLTDLAELAGWDESELKIRKAKVLVEYGL